MKPFIFIFTFILINSCSTSRKNSVYFHDGTPRECWRSDHKKGYKRIVDDKFLSINENDTLLINEIRFECTNTAFKLSEAMYNAYGKWESMVFLDYQSPLLVWNNLSLFDRDTTRYTVITNGVEDYGIIYGSGMVFSNGEDILDDPNLNQKIKIHFTKLMENVAANRNDEFYKVYWKQRNPDLKL
jgi:hypothetical protein